MSRVALSLLLCLAVLCTCCLVSASPAAGTLPPPNVFGFSSSSHAAVDEGWLQRASSWVNSWLVSDASSSLVDDDHFTASLFSDLAYKADCGADQLQRRLAERVDPSALADFEGWTTSSPLSSPGQGIVWCRFTHSRRSLQVIAFKGTDSISTFLVDVVLMFGPWPPMSWLLIKHKFDEQLRPGNGKLSFAFTGHSLGGALAEYAACQYNTVGLTFESPAPAIAGCASGWHSRGWIKSFVSTAPNIVNSLHAPVGRAFLVASPASLRAFHSPILLLAPMMALVVYHMSWIKYARDSVRKFYVAIFIGCEVGRWLLHEFRLCGSVTNLALFLELLFFGLCVWRGSSTGLPPRQRHNAPPPGAWRTRLQLLLRMWQLPVMARCFLALLMAMTCAGVHSLLVTHSIFDMTSALAQHRTGGASVMEVDHLDRSWADLAILLWTLALVAILCGCVWLEQVGANSPDHVKVLSLQIGLVAVRLVCFEQFDVTFTGLLGLGLASFTVARWRARHVPQVQPHLA